MPPVRTPLLTARNLFTLLLRREQLPRLPPSQLNVTHLPPITYSLSTIPATTHRRSPRLRHPRFDTNQHHPRPQNAHSPPLPVPKGRHPRHCQRQRHRNPRLLRPLRRQTIPIPKRQLSRPNNIHGIQPHRRVLGSRFRHRDCALIPLRGSQDGTGQGTGSGESDMEWGKCVEYGDG